MTDQQTSHGHVVPRPDGSRARCGGPGMCPVCAAERARVHDLALTALTAALPVRGAAAAQYARIVRARLHADGWAITPLPGRGTA